MPKEFHFSAKLAFSNVVQSKPYVRKVSDNRVQLEQIFFEALGVY
jgi:hypothetical protein